MVKFGTCKLAEDNSQFYIKFNLEDSDATICITFNLIVKKLVHNLQQKFFEYKSYLISYTL